MLIKLLFLIFLKISLSSSSCAIEKDHCSRCNPVTKLSTKCDKDIYVPDKNGGCQYSHKCIVGMNKCNECNEEGDLCNKCVEGNFPDENGGCSYTDNCEISYRGLCLKCKDNFILIGEKNVYDNEEIKICKSLRDLKNCEKINKSNGLCEKCKKGFYLNSGDNNCVETENCYESILDMCIKCDRRYYLDKKELKCKNQTENENGIFEHCKESLDGKKCDVCDDDYYFDEKGKCLAVNYCLKQINEFQCEKCASNYFLSKYKTSCVTTANCLYGDSNLGVCTSCIDNHYIDFKDGICKSNKEDNEFKYCRIADNNHCTQCISKYELSEDNKCTNTKHCAEVENGKCLSCSDNYYLGLDNQCTNIKHCIYSINYKCIECEKNYYYDIEENKCVLGEDNFENCKLGNSSSFCKICKDDYYLNQKDNLCYNNKEEGKFYKCAKTDLDGKKCLECKDGYYLGDKDNKCTTVEGCILSEDENKCLECDLYYCLNAKTGKCINNDIIEDEEKKFYFRCNKTNKEGNECKTCEDGYILSEDGLCLDDRHCEDKNEDGKCIKCKNKEGQYYCLNKDFECVEIYYSNNCLRCNNNTDFAKCNKCFDGYSLDDDGNCQKEEDI